MVRTTCPYCRSAERRSGPERLGLRYATCSRCGSGYVVSEPPDFRAFYQEYDPEMVRDLSASVRLRYLEILSLLADLAPGRRLLEVGCGNGHLLDTARRAGWQVWGTELSRSHVERARSTGIEVVYGDVVTEPLLAGRTFDAVVALEVIEHLPEPHAFFDVAAARVAPGGVLFLTTPNYGSVTRRLLGGAWSVLGEEHVALATPRGLGTALRSAGFEVLRMRCKNLYLGDYRRVLARGQAGRGATVSLAAENAALRDRIHGSKVLSALRSAANTALSVTGLGEAIECVARRVGGVG